MALTSGSNAVRWDMVDKPDAAAAEPGTSAPAQPPEGDARSDWAAIEEDVAKPVSSNPIIKLHEPPKPNKILKK